MLQRFDDLDMKLLFELSKDGNISVPTLSKKLGVSASVLYSRIKRLVRKKLIKKFTIEIDDSLLAGISVKASVGINRDPKFKTQIHKKLLEVSEVISISEVTGRFDIMIRVYTQDLEDLQYCCYRKNWKKLREYRTLKLLWNYKKPTRSLYILPKMYRSKKLLEFTIPLAFVHFRSKFLRSFSFNFNS